MNLFSRFINNEGEKTTPTKVGRVSVRQILKHFLVTAPTGVEI